MNSSKKLAAMGGFILMGLSPSFIDYQQSPSKRKSMLAFYVVGLFLVYYGLLS